MLDTQGLSVWVEGRLNIRETGELLNTANSTAAILVVASSLDSAIFVHYHRMVAAGCEVHDTSMRLIVSGQGWCWR
jgi:hypothetical protein